MDRNRLLAAHVELRTYLLAQEDWHPNYRTNPKAFRMLTRAEAQVESNMREYLHTLPERLRHLIDWNEVYSRMAEKKKPDVTVTVSGDGWQTEADLLTIALLDPLTDAMVAGTLIAEANVGVQIGVGVGNAAILQAARESTAALVKGLNATTRNQISQAIQNGLAQHEDIHQITERVSEVVNDPARAELIARTEAVRAATHGQLLLAEQIGAQFKVWQDGQAGECPICISVKPKRIPITDSFGDNFPEGPPAHPRCILPGQEVIASNVFATFASDYSGEVYRIETISGNKIAVTPNHPVLTGSGWVKASELHKGDYLVNTSGDVEWMGSNFISPDIETVKAAIEHITVSGKVLLGSVPSSAVDFHGDGASCKNIDIVYSERALLDAPHTKVCKSCRDKILKWARIGSSPELSPSLTDFVIEGKPLSSNGVMSGFSPSTPLLGTAGGLIQPVGSSVVPDRYTELLQTIGDSGTVNAQFMGELVNAAPVSVFLDKIISIDSDVYHGKVYDLSALNQVYTCNGIVVHNCRCGLSLDFATPEEAAALADGTYDPMNFV